MEEPGGYKGGGGAGATRRVGGWGYRYLPPPPPDVRATAHRPMGEVRVLGHTRCPSNGGSLSRHRLRGRPIVASTLAFHGACVG